MSTYMAPGAEEGRCGAQLRGQPGRYCQKWPIAGRTRCRLHGGASPAGRNHPSWQHGRRSKYVVKQWVYQRAVDDLERARYAYARAPLPAVYERREFERCQRAYDTLIEGKEVFVREWSYL